MDTDQLIAFQRVVREGSFTRAALGLGIGQPAVSARIAGLEAAVGGVLFTRGRQVKLTALGESFLPFSRRATEVLAEGLEASRLINSGQRGRVTLAALGSLSAGLIAPAVARMAAEHSELEWFLRSADHEGVLAMLLDGLVELGVVVWPCREAGAAELTRLFVMREPVVLVVAPHHPLAQRRRVAREDIIRLGSPFLRMRWWRTHHPEILRLAGQTKTTMDVPMETARFLVTRGLASGFFPTTYIADDIRDRRVVPLKVHDMPALTRSLALVRARRPAPPSTAFANVIAELRSQAKELGLLTR